MFTRNRDINEGKETEGMEQVKKVLIRIICGAAGIALLTAAVLFAYRYFSPCSTNTRTLEAVLSKAGLDGVQNGSVGDLLVLDYDKLYVFAPYENKERMELKLGFKTSVLKESVSENMLNYMFVKDGRPAAYLYGYPESIGYCINLKSGAYLKSQLDEMKYEVQTIDVGNSIGKEKTYQDYNFYFKDTIEQPASSVVVQSVNAAMSVPMGEEITVRLTGEGTETIRYSVSEDKDGSRRIEEFSINGKDFSKELKDRIMKPNMEKFYIIDLVADDDYKEIAIFDEGPSWDPETHFFRYHNGRMVYLGSITDYPDSDTCHFQNAGNSQGEIVASFRLNILQTWFAQGYWKLNKNNYLEFQEQSVYYPIREYTAELLQELTVYEDRNLESVSFQMQPGKVSFLATDNKNWVQIEDKNGAQGWFYIEGYDTIADVGSISEVFEGLEIYD